MVAALVATVWWWVCEICGRNDEDHAQNKQTYTHIHTQNKTKIKTKMIIQKYTKTNKHKEKQATNYIRKQTPPNTNTEERRREEREERRKHVANRAKCRAARKG